MKKTRFAALILVLFAACKGAYNSTNATAVQTLSGEFLYADNAAVLRTDADIYGVVANEKMQELSQKSETLKADKYDMVWVTVKGIIRKNPQPGGWSEIVEIKNILSVEKSEERESEIIIKNQ
jgi:hypothetical protein